LDLVRDLCDVLMFGLLVISNIQWAAARMEVETWHKSGRTFLTALSMASIYTVSTLTVSASV